jgi:hypothetical protein
VFLSLQTTQYTPNPSKSLLDPFAFDYRAFLSDVGIHGLSEIWVWISDKRDDGLKAKQSIDVKKSKNAKI